MQPVAAILSPPQAADVADYFSSVRAPSHPVSAAAALLTAGQALAERGRWSDGLPACDDCHAAKGIGVIPSFPYLAGQQADYLTRRIRAWRDGESHDDALGLMRAVASKLRDPDIAAVAAYYASLTAPARQGEN
jgi:cytochrome c553